MVQGKWIRPPSKKGRFGASVVFYPLAFSNLFRIASNRSSYELKYQDDSSL